MFMACNKFIYHHIVENIKIVVCLTGCCLKAGLLCEVVYKAIRKKTLYIYKIINFNRYIIKNEWNKHFHKYPYIFTFHMSNFDIFIMFRINYKKHIHTKKLINAHLLLIYLELILGGRNFTPSRKHILYIIMYHLLWS